MNGTKIRISNGPGRSWTHAEDVHVCGHLILGRRILEKADLVDWVRRVQNDLSSALSEVAGEFALIVELDDDTCLLAVDSIRSFPLFFGRDASGAVVSDRAETVASEIGSSPADDVDKLAFLLQGMCLNDATLAGGVSQVRAGELVTMHRGGVTTKLYVQPGHIVLPEERRERLDQAVSTIEEAFNRMMPTIDGPVAVPLSGGLDSRLVAAMLVRNGRTDTLCFTYGSRRSFDATVSRHVAEQLGLSWHFVPYSSRRWKKWASSSQFASYRRRASNLTAIEHEQDWPAVGLLAESGKMPSNALVVPGHSGDFLAGSHLPTEAFEVGQSRALDWIWNRYFTLWPTSHVPEPLLERLRNRILASIDEPASDVRRFDNFGWRNRQAMMIVNSVRAYEDHGLDWRLPLWDRGMIEFWLSLPTSDRRDKNLYRDAVRCLIGSLADIPATDRRWAIRQHVSTKLWDNGLHRYAMFRGLRPGRNTRVISDLVSDPDDVVQAVVRPVQSMPIRRVSINALLALLQLEDSLALVRGWPPTTRSRHETHGPRADHL